MSWSGRRAAFACLVVCVVTGACGGLPAEVEQDPFGFAAGTVLLTVQNHSVRNARVYAYWNGVRERVGMVTARTTETFSLKWRHEEVELGYEFMGRRAIPGAANQRDAFNPIDGYRSPPLPVTQGDHLDFVIRPTS